MKLLLHGVAGATVSLFVALAAMRSTRLSAVNHRGRRVPVVLGVALTAGLVASLSPRLPGWGREARSTAAVLVGALLVFLGGLYDDLRDTRSRGMMNQLAPLLHGRITPGAVKLLAAVGAAALVAGELSDHRTVALLWGVPVMAGASNAVNLLDVRPGRALKYFVPAALILGLLGRGTEYAIVVAAALGAAIAVFPFDLRERAMLGDAGSNVLGFILGVGLYESLREVGLAVALMAILVLHALAETVTLSRIIRAVPPLRWFDDLGCYEAPGSSDTMKSRSA
jgi:UDP-GlcNAc:undecaprenyl-phosphate GlcNAc-1-phosphate transferase